MQHNSLYFLCLNCALSNVTSIHSNVTSVHELQIIVYKYRNGLAPRYLYDMFGANSSDSSYNLQNTATDLKLPKKTFSNGQKGLSYNGAKMWNSLLTESKMAPSLASFKKSLVHKT